MERTSTRASYSENEINSASRSREAISSLDEIASLDAEINAQMQTMKEKLAAGQTLFELGVDAERLTLLVRSRRGKIESLARQSRSATASR
jgi:hypothetical protein